MKCWRLRWWSNLFKSRSRLRISIWIARKDIEKERYKIVYWPSCLMNLSIAYSWDFIMTSWLSLALLLSANPSIRTSILSITTACFYSLSSRTSNKRDALSEILSMMRMKLKTIIRPTFIPKRHTKTLFLLALVIPPSWNLGN